jgi:phospholipid-translocating ATPase/phospholipid-transporting ATPase
MYSIFEEKNDHLPPSLPNNWPHPTQFDLKASPQREIHVGTSQAYSFSKNFVKTSKYELWNFLPKFLIETFNPRSKIANCYFLLIAICQCIPAISNTSGYPTTLIPLIVVVTIDGIFQALEDINRHKADLEANSSITKRYDHKTGRFFDVEWSFVEVGDILKVCSHENLPADLVVLCVSGKSENKHPSSVCYVETKSLDGETNLKIKNALPITFNKACSINFLMIIYIKIL